LKEAELPYKPPKIQKKTVATKVCGGEAQLNITVIAEKDASEIAESPAEEKEVKH
jgi:hypothetical protein